MGSSCSCCKPYCPCCACCCPPETKGYSQVNNNEDRNGMVIIQVKDGQDEKENLLEEHKIKERAEQSGMGDFTNNYSFNCKQTVILQHYFGESIANNKGKLNKDGGTDETAEFNIEFDGEEYPKNNVIIIKFKNTANGKYLRMTDNGKVIDCEGNGGKTCRFKVHETDDNLYKFESTVFNNKYVAVNNGDDNVSVSDGNDELSKFSVWSNNIDHRKQSGYGSFIHPFGFKSQQTVILNHYFGKTLNHDNNGKLNKDGAINSLSQFVAEIDKDGNGEQVQLKSVETDQYIRIIDINGDKIDCLGTNDEQFTKFKVHKTGDNSYKFESCVYAKKYIGVHPEDVVVGNGDKYCEFTVYSNKKDKMDKRDKKEESKQVFNIPYIMTTNKGQVIMKHIMGNTVRIRPNDEDELDDNGGSGKFARWIIEFDGEEDNKKVVKIKSGKSNKYINILDDGQVINCGDSDGNKFGRFKVYKCASNGGDGNKYKFESCQFAKRYIAVQENGGIVIGSGNDKYCEFSLFCNINNQKKEEKREEKKEDDDNKELEKEQDDENENEIERNWYDNIQEISSFLKKQKKKNKDKKIELTLSFWRSLNKKKAKKLDKIMMELQEFVGITNFHLRMTIWERVDQRRKKLNTMSGLTKLLYQLVIEYINQKDKKRRKPEEKNVKTFMQYIAVNITELQNFPEKQKKEMEKEEFARSIDNWMTALIEEFKDE